MDDNTTAVAIFSTFFLFGFPLLAWIVFRYLAHRERMEMIRHGMAPGTKLPRRPVQPGDYTSPTYSAADAHLTLRKGIRLTAIGMAMTIGLSFIGFRHDEMHLGPWLLGGLIPLFIGLAQVVIALLSGATLRPGPGWEPQAPGYHAEPARPGGAATASPSYDTSYTYRPGGAQELRPPGTPPERRI